MFSIFSKKVFLADFLGGLTDMHCHLLPGIDDGAKDEAVAVEMLSAYTSLGYVGTVCTPHMMQDYYQNTSNKIQHSLIEFEKIKNKKGFIDFAITAAAEYMLDDQFASLLSENDLLPVIHTSVLVEMSFLQQPVTAEEQLFTLQQKDFTPILAHPERYGYLKTPEEVLYFKQRGCELQLNALSLSGHYGKPVQKQAFALLTGDHYSYLGTDAHKPLHFSLLKEITLSKKMVAPLERLISSTKEKISF